MTHPLGRGYGVQPSNNPNPVPPTGGTGITKKEEKMSEREVIAFEVPPSKIVQITAAYNDVLNALCEDGSVWSHWSDGLWHQISPAHVANRQQPGADADETQREPLGIEWLEARYNPPPDLLSRRHQGMSIAVLVSDQDRHVQAARKLGDIWISASGEVVEAVLAWALFPEGPKVKP